MVQSIEELEKAGRFALPHSELVDLAKDPSLSVKQVQRAAVARKWPPRQVKAVRALAILRRDHGSEALEGFITRMECARRDQPETEQAQRRRQMEEKIRTRLHLLTKPVDKLELLLRHEMRDDLATLVMELTEHYRTYFKVDVDPHSVKVYFDTIMDVPCDSTNTEQLETFEWAREHRKRICVVWVTKEATGKEEAEAIYIDLAGLQQYLGWSKQQVADLVRKAMTRIVSEGPMPTNWRWVYGIHDVAALVLSEDDELRIKVELWNLQSHFRRGRLFEIRREVLGIQERATSEKEELNPLVDRFLALGWSEQQVREEFLAMMRKAVGDCRPQFMLAMAGAKCFTHDRDHGDPEVSAILRPVYLKSLWDDYFVKMDYPPVWFLKCFMQLGCCGLWERREKVSYRDYTPVENDHAFFRQKIMEMVARGEVNKAFQLVLFFGESWGLFYGGRATSQHLTNPTKWFSSLLPDAYRLAKDQQRFGVASALLQHYGVEAILPEEGVDHQLAEAFQSRINEAYKEIWPDVDNDWWDLSDLEREFELTEFIEGLNEQGECYSDLYEDDRRDEIPPTVMETAQAHHAKAIELLAQIKQECDYARCALMHHRSQELREVTEIALDLGQPIRLDTGYYLESPVKFSRD